MTKCNVCEDTGVISRDRFGYYRAGNDRRYGLIDACPKCAYVAELEYDSYTALRVQHGMTP